MGTDAKKPEADQKPAPDEGTTSDEGSEIGELLEFDPELYDEPMSKEEIEEMLGES